MTLTPRLMVIDSLSTFVGDVFGDIKSQKQQTLCLTLLSRSASAEFENKFTKQPVTMDQKKAILDYARENAIESLGYNGSSFAHSRVHQVKGMDYHLGDIVTEQEAFDFLTGFIPRCSATIR